MKTYKEDKCSDVENCWVFSVKISRLKIALKITFEFAATSQKFCHLIFKIRPEFRWLTSVNKNVQNYVSV